jgi:hypothetical protein
MDRISCLYIAGLGAAGIALVAGTAAAQGRTDAATGVDVSVAAALAASSGLFLVLLVLALVGIHRRYFAFLDARGADMAADAVAAARASPFGLPDGTIRAALALVIAVAGVGALTFQVPLGLSGAGELVSILGTVIGFYFGARGGESANGLQAQRAADTAHAAKAEAQSARAAIATMTDRPPTPPAPVDGQDRLSVVRDRLAEGRRIVAILAAAPGGPPLLRDAGAVLATVDATLAAIQPLTTGRADVAAVAGALAQGGAALDALDRAGLPGILGDAVATLGGTVRALGDAASTGATVATALGGPVGIVAALALGGLSLVRERERHAAWTRAVLDLPPRPLDLPDRPTAADAAFAVDAVPGLRARLSTGGTLRVDLALDLLTAAGKADGAGGLVPVTAVAADLLTAPSIAAVFDDAATLADAIAGLRRASAFDRWQRSLPATIPVARPGEPAMPVPVPALLATVAALRTDPHAAAEIDRLVSLAQVLGEAGAANGFDAPSLLVEALSKAADLAERERQSRRGDPETPR